MKKSFSYREKDRPAGAHEYAADQTVSAVAAKNAPPQAPHPSEAPQRTPSPSSAVTFRLRLVAARTRPCAEMPFTPDIKAFL